MALSALAAHARLAAGIVAAFAATDRGGACLTYCGCFTALGLCLSALGPVLLDLAVQTQSSLTATGYCFGVRSVGYLLGSMGGPLYDRWPGHRILGTAMFAAALGTMLIPLVTTVQALGFAVLLQGVAMGFCDTGGNVMMIWWFTHEVGPYMQGMHFAFALGAFLGPMLLRLVAAAAGDTGAGGPPRERPGGRPARPRQNDAPL
jgi:MFS family permease